MNTRIDDLLQTQQYWFVDKRGNIHAVFAKSELIARQYARAKGFVFNQSGPPTNISPIIIHNANIWYETILMPDINLQ